VANPERRGRPPELPATWRAAALIGFALWGASIVLPRAFETHNYPAGDPRNEPAFWLVVVVVFVAFVAGALVDAIRGLRRPRR
jgi:hypothetical protein